MAENERMVLGFGEFVRFNALVFNNRVCFTVGVSAACDAEIFSFDLFNKGTPYIVEKSMPENEIRLKLNDFIKFKLRKILPLVFETEGVEALENEKEKLSGCVFNYLKPELEKFGIRISFFKLEHVKFPENDIVYAKYRELKSLREGNNLSYNERLEKEREKARQKIENAERNAQRVQKLNQMFAMGLITEAEYKNKVSEILIDLQK